ncbi:hypothetical protein L3Q82_026417 [Scortum barcoo]|uniref:Uncharacterized protein n=1 Tax=Scortum barcoo TaxID=214431 RepID=A0ACB8WIR1_9TELE|nr:hypothetical protein L3Q82_026417 [Scortum barcoo]
MLCWEFHCISGWMEKPKKYRWMFIMLFIITFIILLWIIVRTPSTFRSIPQPRGAPKSCPLLISEQTITPVPNTKHLLVSVYMDQRVDGFDIRIIGIFRRDSIQPLHCLFCCAGHLSSTTPTTILQHSDNFGFPFVTTDVMCKIPQDCDATHVALVTQPDSVSTFNQAWLSIRNKKTDGKEEKKFDFTICISNLFGDYNNVLQFAQTLEMYRLLGVDKVVIYNTSCGPDLNRLLQSYRQDGFVEIVPWPIDQYLNPSSGWLFSKHGGDVHYFGQLTTLNECIYRSMERSRYVLLNDIDEIIMPYKHNDLISLMNVLQQQHPNTGVFLIENHIFPKKPFEESKKSLLPTWRGVPGFNILEHIYREEPDRNVYHPHKMIVQPRMVKQTSVHEVLQMIGEKFKVPPDVCRIIHCPMHTPTRRPLEDLHMDYRLWDFTDKLLPSVSKGEEKRASTVPWGAPVLLTTVSVRRDVLQPMTYCGLPVSLSPKQSGLDGIEGTGEVQEKNPHCAASLIQMGVGSMEQVEDGILHTNTWLARQREYRECSLMHFTETQLAEQPHPGRTGAAGRISSRQSGQEYKGELANADAACELLHSVVAQLQTEHPQAFLLITGDFNHASLSATLPNFHQYVNCCTRDNKTLDLLYANTAGATPLITPPPTGPLRSQPGPSAPCLHTCGEETAPQQKACEAVPKTSRPKEPNHFRPVALTFHLMKALERIVLSQHLRPLVSPNMDPLQFAYQPGIGVDDAVIYLLQRSLSHLEDAGNTTPVCEAAGLCVRCGVVVCSTGAPQGTVLSPFLFPCTLYIGLHILYSTDSCHLQKFSDDTAIVGCVSEGNDLVCWGGGCSERDKKRLNRLIKRASSVCGCPLDSIEVMGERRALAKLSTIMDNTSHPLHQTVGALSSSFSNRLRHPRCRKERFRSNIKLEELKKHYCEIHILIFLVGSLSLLWLDGEAKRLQSEGHHPSHHYLYLPPLHHCENTQLLGVDRVVIYKTSCGPDLNRLLQSYRQEGFVEIVPWPIDQYLNPSSGWLFSLNGGDLHYFGQLTTLNECIYRSMERSRYVLLNDIDEIIMPYKHNDLMSLMNVLQQQHPNTGVFLIENHIFPKKHFEPSGKFHLPQWNGVPGINILEHIYRENPNRNTYHPHKMIVQPRMVEQTSVHEVLKNFGKVHKVPLDVCRIIHVRVALQGSLTLEQLNVDKRLWDFSEKLIPNVDKHLKRAGLLNSEGRS